MKIFFSSNGASQLQLDYRIPKDFKWCGSTWLTAIRIWLIHFWSTDMCGVWHTYGGRILGVELSYRIYK